MASDGMNTEDIIESKIMFQLPDGDGGLARKREIQEFVCDSGLSATFGEGETTNITLASNGLMIDPSQTMLSFRIKTSGFTGQAILPCGAASLINQLDIYSFGGVSMESLPDYNLIAAILDRYTLSDRWYKEFGALEAYPPIYGDASEQDAFVAGQALSIDSASEAAFNFGVQAVSTTPGYAPQTGGCGRRGAVQRYCQSFHAGRQIVMPLRHSGLFGTNRYIPLNVLGNIRISIKWELAKKCFQSITLPSVYNTALGVPIKTAHDAGALDTTDDDLNVVLAAGTTAANVVDANVITVNRIQRNGGRGDCWRTLCAADWATAPTHVIGSYQISQVKLVAAVVQLSSAMQMSIDNAVRGAGLPLHFPTFNRARLNLAAETTGTVSLVLPKNVSNALALFAVFQTDPANTTAVASATQTSVCGGAFYGAVANKFDFWQKGVSQWQFRVGTEVFPRFQVRDPMVGMRLSMEAVPKFPWADKSASVPYARYSSRYEQYVPLALGTAADLAVSSATSAAACTPTRMFNNPAVCLDDQWYPNSFVMGVNLQSTPGLPLSGISTVSGAQPMIELLMQNSSELGARVGKNERIDLKSDLVFIMQYTRVLMITPGQNVIVKE